MFGSPSAFLWRLFCWRIHCSFELMLALFRNHVIKRVSSGGTALLLRWAILRIPNEEVIQVF
jgi:hypothetical protein